MDLADRHDRLDRVQKLAIESLGIILGIGRRVVIRAAQNVADAGAVQAVLLQQICVFRVDPCLVVIVEYAEFVDNLIRLALVHIL